MNEDIKLENNIFFYDGECNFCSHLADKLKNLNQNKNLKFLSFREFDSDLLNKFHSQLTEDILEGEVQLIYENKRYPGFFAVRKILPSLSIYWIFTPFLYLPLIPFLGMFVMQLLKRGRNLN
jgi:predicted DCC family thiol-disulfide oxidoreductase YuxK